MCKTAPARSEARRGDDVTQQSTHRPRTTTTSHDSPTEERKGRRVVSSPVRLPRGDSRGEASLGAGEARWISPPKHVGRRSPERRPRDDGRRRNLPSRVRAEGATSTSGDRRACRRARAVCLDWTTDGGVEFVEDREPGTGDRGPGTGGSGDAARAWAGRRPGRAARRVRAPFSLASSASSASVAALNRRCVERGV
jgi:hypothetical protein